ncbi:hypothetical protein D3C71_1803980 [compost metagenome]
MHALVGADGHGASDRGERLVAAGRQRLLDQVDALLGANREVIGEGLSRPALIGIENDAALRCAFAHGADA